MAKRRKPWERLYDGIRVVRHPDYVSMPSLVDADLDQVESQLGSRLPHSYREFMKRFGPGELQGWVRLNRITPERNGAQRTVTGRTTAIRDYYLKHSARPHHHQWLSSLIYFASDGGGNEFAWDPAAITQNQPLECRFYFLPRHYEDQPVATGDSFWQFVKWVETDVHSWRDPERLEEDGRGLYFNPVYLRAKKPPLKRDVKVWLAWNNGTVLRLAREIRDERQTEFFPVLADALEEAGCKNADLLVSCRQGVPEIDGIWILRVLLGKREGRQNKTCT